MIGISEQSNMKKLGQMKRLSGSNETFHLTQRTTVSFDPFVYDKIFLI